MARGRRCGGGAAPRDESVDRAAEVPLVHVVEERDKVVMVALGDEWGHHRAHGADAMAVGVDVAADGQRSDAIAPRDVANERLLYGSGSVEEHQMKARPEDAPPPRVRDHAVTVVGHREHDGPRERGAQAALERLTRTFVNEDMGLALGKGQRDLRRVNRIRNAQRRRRHARSNLRAQSTTSHPTNRTLKKREDGLSAHRSRPSQDGVWGVPILVKQALFHLLN